MREGGRERERGGGGGERAVYHALSSYDSKSYYFLIVIFSQFFLTIHMPVCISIVHPNLISSSFNNLLYQTRDQDPFPKPSQRYILCQRHK